MGSVVSKSIQWLVCVRENKNETSNLSVRTENINRISGHFVEVLLTYIQVILKFVDKRSIDPGRIYYIVY